MSVIGLRDDLMECCRHSKWVYPLTTYLRGTAQQQAAPEDLNCRLAVSCLVRQFGQTAPTPLQIEVICYAASTVSQDNAATILAVSPRNSQSAQNGKQGLWSPDDRQPGDGATVGSNDPTPVGDMQPLIWCFTKGA